MATIEVSYSEEIGFEPEKAYELIADYKNGHPHILPTAYFRDLKVEEGGHGAGTVVSVVAKMLGTERMFRMTVTEPEPGRILEEADVAAKTVTRFTVEPLDGGKSSRVTISTFLPVQPGVRGKIEQWITPFLLKQVYRAELKQMNQHLRWIQAGDWGIYS